MSAARRAKSRSSRSPLWITQCQYRWSLYPLRKYGVTPFPAEPKQIPMSISLDEWMRLLAKDPKRKARRISCLSLKKIFRDLTFFGFLSIPGLGEEGAMIFPRISNSFSAAVISLLPWDGQQMVTFGTPPTGIGHVSWRWHVSRN